MKKKILTLIAFFAISMVYAQQMKFIIDSRTLKHANNNSFANEKFSEIKQIIPNSNNVSKALNSHVIGTSSNIYTVLHENANYLDANTETGTIMFTHRMGGTWGGSSGNIRCKFTSNFGTTWDSVQFITVAPNLMRYPNGVIYNPPGNTNPLSAYAIVCGPSTNGADWINNFFGSQKLDGTDLNLQFMPVSLDSSIATKSNLVSGNGRFHILSTVSNPLNAGEIYYYQVTNGIFNTITKTVDWTKSYIHTLFKRRGFSNGDATWSANPNIAFAPDGLHGYFYTFGVDSFVDPYNTSIPLIWKTSDGGATWTKQPVYEGFDNIPVFRQYLWPTQATATLPISEQVFRPDFKCGSSIDEENFPGIVDVNGILHFICIVEGKYSSHPDSLFYNYTNHPKLIFDVYTSGTSWNAVFIDTLRTSPVEPPYSGFGFGVDAIGWKHWLKLSKSSDGKKIFATWTDTDSSIDTTNIMPEVHSWGFNIESLNKTNPTLFQSSNPNIFYMQTPDIILNSGTDDKIPVTYLDIYESGPDPLQPQKHYLLDGIQFNSSDYISPACYINTDIGQNTDICLGESYTLNNTINGGNSPFTYQWNTGETTSTLNISPNSTTTYKVTVTDINNCKATAQITLGIYPPPAEFSLDTTLCNESVISLSAYTPNATYLWNNQSTNSSIQVFADGTYTVTVTRCGTSVTDTFIVAAYNCLNSITGLVFKDYNNNGIADNGEPGMPNVIVKLTPGNLYYSTDYNGIFHAMADTGNYIVTIPNPPSNYTSSTAFHTAYFNNYALSDINNNFAMYPVPEPDAAIYIFANNARPGFDVNYHLTCKNEGNITLNGEVKFIKNNLLTYISSNPTPTSISGDTIKWNYSNITPEHSEIITILTNLPQTVALGTPLQSVASISSNVGDSVLNNNHYILEQIVTGSYDPNDKSINPRILTPDYVSQLKSLVYTIRFQNTGTDTAFTIKVRDTLCPNVNPATFELITSSHPCTFNMYGQGIIEFTFANILLADSNTNEPLSHGFVMYKVLPKDSLEIGDTITNFADIYFDYNIPVRTNTVISPIVDTLLFSNKFNTNNNLNIKVFPNPFSNELNIQYEIKSISDIEIIFYNILGDEVESVFLGKQYAGLHTFKSSKLKNIPNGVYLIKLTENGKSSFTRIVKTK